MELSDRILVELGEKLPKRKVPFVEVILLIFSEKTNAWGIIQELFYLETSGFITQEHGFITKNRDSTTACTLTPLGLSRVKDLFWDGVGFQEEWLTPDVIRKVVTGEHEILHDALYEAGATEIVLTACKHPVKKRWLTQKIKQTGAFKKFVRAYGV